jgi:hypothetical protein
MHQDQGFIPLLYYYDCVVCAFLRFHGLRIAREQVMQRHPRSEGQVLKLNDLMVTIKTRCMVTSMIQYPAMKGGPTGFELLLPQSTTTITFFRHWERATRRVPRAWRRFAAAVLERFSQLKREAHRNLSVVVHRQHANFTYCRLSM